MNSLQKTILIDLDRLTHQINRSRAEICQRKRAIINTYERIENLSRYFVILKIYFLFYVFTKKNW